jgi:choline dehydrogenase-like flavoprotein
MGLNDAQIATLAVFCDTLVPSVQRAEDPDGYFGRKATDTGTHAVIAAILEAAPPEAAAQIGLLLDLLGSPGLGATWGGPAKRLEELDAEERESVVLAWMQSPSPELRAAYSVLASLVLSVYYGWSDDRGPNPNWKSIGYDGPVSPPPKIERPIKPLVIDRDLVLDCDTVVVGSGAGGGVVAGELADAGHEVIVIEKGPYVAEDGFTQRELEMMLQLYEKGGALRTKNAAIGVLAGSCLGGGTTINWTGALRTPDYVLAEWAHEHGNLHLLTAEFRNSIEAVERATHVGLEESHVDRKGELLRLGAQKLGYVVNTYPRNVKGCDPKHCGYCNFGCQLGAKQGTLKTYLQRTFNQGARILVGTEVARVVTEAGRARGVEALHRKPDGTVHRVTVRAKRVVVAAGSLHTPALLRRSGLTHEHIGRNLFIHPAAAVVARYPDPVRAWSGSMMPVACDEFTRLDGNYGFKLINAPLHPGWLCGVAWRSGADHKERMLESSRIASVGAFVRERDTGRIELDASGQPVVDYWPSTYDMQHLVRGLQEAARIHFEAGAELLYLPGYRRFDTSEGKRKLEALLEEMAASGLEPNLLPVLTAHQMGTCRMGGDAARHPVTPGGETREIKNLFVADASTFPTCSGANPMPSVQHIAHFTARGIAARDGFGRNAAGT